MDEATKDARTTKYDWSELDTETFPENIKKEYDQYKLDAQETAEQRKKMEGLVTVLLHSTGQVPAGTGPIYGHNFGKMSVAYKPIGKKGKKISFDKPALKSVS